MNHLLRYSKKMNELKNTTVTDRQSEPGASRVTIDRSEPRLKIVSKKMSESASMDSDIGYEWIKSMESPILNKWTRNTELS